MGCKYLYKDKFQQLKCQNSKILCPFQYFCNAAKCYKSTATPEKCKDFKPEHTDDNKTE